MDRLVPDKNKLVLKFLTIANIRHFNPCSLGTSECDV